MPVDNAGNQALEALIGETPSVIVADVYSFAHDIPNSYSDAAGLAQHDNLFWLHWTGDPNDQPDTGWVTVSLTGEWFLGGYSEPDDNWWADVLLYGEVYDEGGGALDSASEYHFLEGPGFASDGGSVNLEMQAELQYDTPYALRFYIDAESHAEAVPEPGTLGLLLLGSLVVLNRRR